eukprot:5192474-Prymnesium_polylepis.1
MLRETDGTWHNGYTHAWTQVRAALRPREYVTGNGRYEGQQPETCVHSGSCSPQATCVGACTARRRDTQSPNAPPSSAAASHTEKGSSISARSGSGSPVPYPRVERKRRGGA